jgi:GDP-L-fucose synthase
MKILLTGGSGMLGKAILRLGPIITPDLEIIAPTRNELNLLDPVVVRHYFAANSFDAVIHTAAKVGGIKANMSDPIGFMSENILMSMHTIEHAHRAGIQNFINLGSSCMYPRNHRNPLVEEDILAAPLEPTNEGYAIAKIAASRLCSYISAQHGVAYKTLIPCNLYGTNDNFDMEQGHMIAASMMKIHMAHRNGDSDVEIWGDGTVRREFLYVDDLAKFILSNVGNIHQFPADLNVGLGYDYTVNEYYQAIAEVIGFKGNFVHNLDAPVGMTHKLMDITKAETFGWSPDTILQDGLKETYSGFLRYFAN